MSTASIRARRPLAALLLPVVASILVACDDAPQGGMAQMPTPEVRVATVREQSVTLSRELPGRTRAYLVAEVRPLVTGVIQERLFDEGSRVEAGTPLYQLDDATYRAEFQSARAAVARAEAAFEIASSNASRAESLIDSGAVSEQELRNLQGTRQQAEAEVAVTKAQLENARLRLAYARIRSPIAGRTGRSTVTPGALVTANQETALTTVQQLDPMYVDVTQSAAEVLRLRRQMTEADVERANELPVTVVLEDGTEYAHEGKLLFSDATVDPTTGSVALRIIVPNPEHLLLPGMYVRAQVSIAIVENALLVPQRGVSRDPRGRAFVMLLTPDNLIERREVEVRTTVGDQWLVTSGLSAGDRVVVEGLQKIRPGQPARVASDEAGAQ